jgi:hypothetical protein
MEKNPMYHRLNPRVQPRIIFKKFGFRMVLTSFLAMEHHEPNECGCILKMMIGREKSYEK